MKNIKTFDTHAEYNAYITGSTAVLPNLSYVKGTDEVHTTRVPSVTATIDVTQTTGVTYVLSVIDDIKAVIIDGVKQNTVQNGYTFSTTGEHTVKYLLNDGVTRLPDSMFDADGKIVRVTKVKMSNGIKVIGNYAFYECGELREVILPNSITNITLDAFYGCSALTSFDIPNSVITIEQSAFGECSGLTSVTIGNGVSIIEQGAFLSCADLERLIIGSGVTNIGSMAFEDCVSLTSITCLATTAPTIQSSTFQSVKTNGTLTVPQGSTGYDVWMGTGNYYLGKYSWTKVEQ